MQRSFPSRTSSRTPSVSTLCFALAGGAVVGFLAGPRADAPPRPRRRRGAGGAPWRVVIVGAGFGGLSAANTLVGKAGVELTLIDAQNHHLFQPLLYQVATAALSSTDIASPVRAILPARSGVNVMMEEVTGIDTAGRRVLYAGGAVPYDELIVSTGSRPSYFGHEDWSEIAPGLKTLEDALVLRRRILEAFEQAAGADEAERARLLTFVLIGGGSTGVEMAGAIAELASDMLARDYNLPDVHPRILLVEAGPRVLAGFAEELGAFAARKLQQMGVEIRTDTKVTGLEDGVVVLGDERVAAGNVIWTAGTEATPVAKWLGVEPGHGGRVSVGADLRVPGHPEVAVIGDAALAHGRDGRELPGLAPVAKQQGEFVARGILRRRRGYRSSQAGGGPRALPPFSYRDYGTLATIGRGKAVAAFGPLRITGVLAWLTWAVAHIFFLIGFRNRIAVSTQWLFAYLAHQRAGRLIIRPDIRP